MKARFGITLRAVDPPARFLELIRLVEESGFDYLWLGDASLYGRYVYAYLTLCALHTSRIKIGPNCTHPYTRHPAVNFSALTTIDELSHGRAIMNVGAGGDSILELGCKVAPVQDVREMVLLGRRLMTGGPIEFTTQGLTLKGARLRFLARKEMPIYLTASGPRMLELGGELCDGVLFMAGIDPSCIAYALDHIRQGAERAGRLAAQIDRACCIFGALAEHRERARERCRRAAAWFVKSQSKYAEIAGIPPIVVDAIRDAILGSALEAEANVTKLVTPDIIDKFTLAGNVKDFRTRIEQILQAGVDHIEFIPEGDDRLEMTRMFGEHVIPYFR